MTNALPKIYDKSPTLGCDPEFFFRKGGEVVGAETFLPKDGLKVDSYNKFIIDGVQAELNPAPNTCRISLSSNITACFRVLQRKIKESGGDISCDFGRAIEISKEKLGELSEEAKKFGCAPSQSIYSTETEIKIQEVNPEEYRVRAAGGHIHFGYDGYANDRLKKALKEDYKRTVELLDIICGNTCVLVDRDPGNIERRKMYGRAGEYRLPKHGLEYRTLSNFWLTAYPLMSLAFGLGRTAVNAMADAKHYDLFYNEFTSKVKQKNIHDAINNNDFDMAMENFKNIEQTLLAVIDNGTGRYPIDKYNINAFHYFVDMINKNGLEYWFKENPIHHWTREVSNSNPRYGFYDFCNTAIMTDFKKYKDNLKKAQNEPVTLLY